jgi:hypothetical protein
MFQGDIIIAPQLLLILRPAYKFFKAMNWFSEAGAQISGAKQYGVGMKSL